MKNPLARIFGAVQSVLAKRVPVVRATYDAARRTTENRRLWENTDSLSASASMSAAVREVLRNNCRYEVANNSYAKGIGNTIADDTIGTGPQLQMLTEDSENNALIEREFWKHCQKIRLAEKLRLMRLARYDSGEVFAIFVSNPGLDSPVKLDIRLKESEECADPSYQFKSDFAGSDGITYDNFGNPSSYRFLKSHPGSTTFSGLPTDHEDVSAKQVFHYFHPDRPGQLRGIPDITPAVTLFGELRRYSAAVIAAAETAADYAMTVESSAPADEDSADTDPMDTFELQRRMATVLPKGWKMNQTKAEQPVTTYGQFVDAKLKEIARCLTVPFTVASLDSSVANMSSAYVDRQVYTHNRLIDRADLEVFVEIDFRLWFEEARLIPDYLPDVGTEPPHQFFWPSLGHHADPLKVANASMVALKAGLTSIPKEHAKNGDDWEEQQVSAAKALGLTIEQYREKLCFSIFGYQQPQQAAVPNPADSAD